MSPRRMLPVLALVSAVLALSPALTFAQQTAPGGGKTTKPAAKPPAKPQAKQSPKKDKDKEPPPVENTGTSQIGIDTLARYAYLVDVSTGTVLLSKDADAKMVPSSMAKMMTIYLLWEEMKAGRVNLDTEFRVSEKAWRMQGSKMFVDINSTVAVKDLIPGIIVHSGNDASVVVAEGIAGSEEAFADRMNKKAKELGMTTTNFKNADGWPAEGQYSSAHDLAILAERTVKDFPDYYKRWYAQPEFRYKNYDPQANRNTLLRRVGGVDGLKTGHTEDGGYGLTASSERDKRRLVLVMNGLPSTKVRTQEGERLLEWAFREFDNYAPYRVGEPIIQADVWLGVQATVPLTIEREVTLTLPRNATQSVKMKAVYDGPVPAPIVKGQKIGKLVISGQGMATLEIPLIATADVERLGLAPRMMRAFRYYIFGQRPQS